GSSSGQNRLFQYSCATGESQEERYFLATVSENKGFCKSFGRNGPKNSGHRLSKHLVFRGILMRSPCIVVHITPDELLTELQGTSHVANGFVNRFLIVDTRREVYIPRNGNWQYALEPFISSIADALAFANNVGLMA